MPGEPWEPVERDRRYTSSKRAGLRRLISEGDSWFDHPPHPDIIDWLDGESIWAIKRFEKSVGTVENLSGETSLSRIAGAAQEEKTEPILCCGGGSDHFTDIRPRPTRRHFNLAPRSMRGAFGPEIGWVGLRQTFLLVR